MIPFSGLILAGGASSRMGTDKGAKLWGTVRAVDRVFRVLTAAGAREVIVSGADYGLAFVPDPPGVRGPVAGVVAGCQALQAKGCRRALIAAVDAPTLRKVDLAPLIEAAVPGAFYLGLPLPMMIDLACLPIDAEPEWPLRRLVERAGLHILNPPLGALERLRGANTPAEMAALRLTPKN